MSRELVMMRGPLAREWPEDQHTELRFCQFVGPEAIAHPLFGRRCVQVSMEREGRTLAVLRLAPEQVEYLHRVLKGVLYPTQEERSS